MLRNLTEKLSKISCDYASSAYSMVKFARLDDSEFFELDASPVEGQSLQ